MRNYRRHASDTRTFKELQYRDQTRSISAQVLVLEASIKANVRRAKKENRINPIQDRIEQVQKMLARLQQ